jgi:hypothetical protein
MSEIKSVKQTVLDMHDDQLQSLESLNNDT